jgi:hypothetical protein
MFIARGVLQVVWTCHHTACDPEKRIHRFHGKHFGRPCFIPFKIKALDDIKTARLWVDGNVTDIFCPLCGEELFDFDAAFHSSTTTPRNLLDSLQASWECFPSTKMKGTW